MSSDIDLSKPLDGVRYERAEGIATITIERVERILIFGDVSALPGRAGEPGPVVKGQGGGLSVLRFAGPGGQWRTL